MAELFRTLKADFKYENVDGCLVQLAHEGFRQINVLKSKKGSSRGGHFHKVSNEAFFIAGGSVNVTLKKDGMEQVKRFKTGDFFLIPVYTWHEMIFPDDCTMVALYDVPIEQKDGQKDIYREAE